MGQARRAEGQVVVDAGVLVREDGRDLSARPRPHFRFVERDVLGGDLKGDGAGGWQLSEGKVGAGTARGCAVAGAMATAV